MGLNKFLNKLETMMDWSMLITVLWAVHRRLERQRRDINTLDKRFKKFKKFVKDAGAQNTKAMKNPNAMKNLARWHSESMLARELLRQRQAAADSPMKAMKAMKVAKKVISVSINAAAAKKAMKATTKTKAMKATKQLPKKETEETASSGSDSSSDSGSDTGSDSD